MAPAMAWWRTISPRERVLVALMLVMLFAVLGWLAIVRPLAIAHGDAQGRQITAQAALDDVNRMSVEIRAIRATRLATISGGARPDLPLLEHVRFSADVAGMTVERLEKAADGGVSLRIPAVRSTALLGWLALLEGNEGLVVERLSAARNDDESLAVDLLVSARER